MTTYHKPLHLALVGQPNSGKTSFFNTLTGYRQKVANYGGVTVNYKVGTFTLTSGRPIQITDLPGIYSNQPISPDEAITHHFLKENHNTIDLLVCVIDATKLSLHLPLVLQMHTLGKPIIVLINRLQQANQHGIHINIARLSEQLGLTVLPTHVKTQEGVSLFLEWLSAQPLSLSLPLPHALASAKALAQSVIASSKDTAFTLEDQIDQWILHPIVGPIFFILLMALMSQMIFIWAEPLKAFIENSTNLIGQWMTYPFPPDSALSSLIQDSIFGGIGTICAFLPQILLLFAFIFILEESGYLPRAVFLLDHLLYKVGLTGRAVIPLLSSFACTIPSIMATRSIQHPRDRLITILILPLVTCSARLPIYVLLISAFIPTHSIFYGLINLQGLVLLGLYIIGLSSALGVAWIMKTIQKQPVEPTLLMELPNYQLPKLQDILLGLWEKTQLFFSRVGGSILALNIILWALCRFPFPPTDAIHPPIYYSAAGYAGRYLSLLFKPLGFHWQICIALIPGLMAREVAISSLSTVYALSDHAASLRTVIANQWSIPTALSLLAWYVFAPQCLSTLTVIQKETGSVRHMVIATSYLFSLAYMMSFLTYQLARLWW